MKRRVYSQRGTAIVPNPIPYTIQQYGMHAKNPLLFLPLELAYLFDLTKYRKSNENDIDHPIEDRNFMEFFKHIHRIRY